MVIMNPRQPVEHMQQVLQALRQRWEATQRLWQDQIQKDFAKAYMEPLDREAQAILVEMQRLAEVMTKAWKNTP